ncbi:tetratricopeptide repeat protein [Novosphingobium cyanobacteriorum]|uniref:Tetratricopeptide repeat protein n=1 Tax=Novosphingobium cyanobacteriorum TaxID=3024215 RepID=A0ABT6CE43_9SPHN|nr:tetratricopeptide repeat protein [Novosphingobium cyanobacteriorum]MDF8332097.1 tetratricopeptide repeat protein [Novosphingobium cyanobacteriorum]
MAAEALPIDEAPEAVDAPAPFSEAIEAIRAGRWAEGLEKADEGIAACHEQPAHLPLLVAIARVRAGQAGVQTIDEGVIEAAGSSIDLRKLLVSPLLLEQRFDEALVLLDRIVAKLPPADVEQQQRARVLGKLHRWDEAIAAVDALHAREPANEALLAQRIQYRISASRVDEAYDIVRAISAAPETERLANLMMLTLMRKQDYDGAGALAERIPREGMKDPVLAGNIVQSLFRTSRYDAAIEAGEELIASGLDGSTLRSHLAQAWYQGGKGEERFARAIAHLEAGVEFQPDNLRMVSLLGQLLLRNGKTQRAIPFLKQAVEMEPQLSEIRALYARALKQVGDYEAAADQFATMLEKGQSTGGRWQRYAAGALAQAGRRDEAMEIFDAWVAQRAQNLPDKFGAGLEALWNKIDEVRIPDARLNWAWSLRSPDYPHDRAEFDRRAKWGHLADHYLLDWLECRDDKVEEAMYHFADELDKVEEFCAEARARAPGKGVVFASAHVGAMYFGPLALELIGERSRWIASTPSVARTSYAETLISTSDQTDTQVARSFMQSLKQDYVVVVVVDGAINLAAPRIPFEGQEITYSEFASRTAHRMGSSSAFVAPVWLDDGHLGFVLEHLPMPEEGESADNYAVRWRDAYLGHLRAFLATKPENLRLSGGIWRHVR